MRRSLINRAVTGFLIGNALIVIVCLLFNRAPDGTVRFVSERFIACTGSESAAVLLQTLLFGLYGAACFGGTMLYGIERWPLALATAAHYLIIAGLYVPVTMLLRWGMPAMEYLILEAAMLVGFFIIWLIMYLRYKAEVRQLNEIREQMERARRDDDHNDTK